jgi:hypothetical protein
MNGRNEEVGDVALAGTVLILVVCDVGDDANFGYS